MQFWPAFTLNPKGGGQISILILTFRRRVTSGGTLFLLVLYLVAPRYLTL